MLADINAFIEYTRNCMDAVRSIDAKGNIRINCPGQRLLNAFGHHIIKSLKMCCGCFFYSIGFGCQKVFDIFLVR